MCSARDRVLTRSLNSRSTSSSVGPALGPIPSDGSSRPADARTVRNSIRSSISAIRVTGGSSAPSFTAAIALRMGRTYHRLKKNETRMPARDITTRMRTNLPFRADRAASYSRSGTSSANVNAGAEQDSPDGCILMGRAPPIRDSPPSVL